MTDHYKSRQIVVNSRESSMDLYGSLLYITLFMRVVAVWHWQAAWCHSFVRGRRCSALWRNCVGRALINSNHRGDKLFDVETPGAKSSLPHIWKQSTVLSLIHKIEYILECSNSETKRQLIWPWAM